MDPVHTPDWIGTDDVATAQRPRRRLWPALVAVAGLVGVATGATIATLADRDDQVPRACLDAIATAEEGFGYTADALAGSQRALEALLVYDTAEIEAATDDMNAAARDMETVRPRWDTTRTECRAAAQ